MSMEWLGTAWAFVRKGSAALAVSLMTVSASAIWVGKVAAVVPAEWRPRLMMAFLASTVLALSHVAEFLRTWACNIWDHRRHIRNIRELPPDAKSLLALLYQEQTLRLDCREALVDMLHSARILYQAPVSHGGTFFDYTLQPWARVALGKRPDLLAGAPRLTAVNIYDRTPSSWDQRRLFGGPG
jgi:hypothetical protein